MSTLKKLREELDQLKSEILTRRASPDQATASASAAGKGASFQETVELQFKELNTMVKTMLDEAETTVSDHPVATVAGALALGIAIGRLTGR